MMIKHMKLLILALVALVTAMESQGATIENDYFALTTPDDSWLLSDDAGVLKSIGARAIAWRRSGEMTSELIRIDCVDGAFDPQRYLQQQMVERHDRFAAGAQQLSAIADTSVLGLQGACIHFVKTQSGRQYRCTAMALGAGFSTLLVITAHRADLADVVGYVVGTGLKLKCDTSRLTTVAQLCQGAQAALKKHRLPVTDNEWLTAVSEPDSLTVGLSILIPYIKAQDINVPAFVQSMRDHWMKTFAAQVRLNRLFAAIVAEQKRIRYTYLDNDGHEIGTLLILPPEYQQLVGCGGGSGDKSDNYNNS